MQWKSRQANILEELLCSANVITTEHLTIIRSYCAKIRDVKEWDDIMSASERVAVLASIRQVAVKLSTLPGQYGIQGETFHWIASYPLNIRLYQKLLFGLYDVLDEDQLIEEADDVLLLIKLTWSSLGITQTMHNALYGWVLFQQEFFVADGEGLPRSLVEQEAKFAQQILGLFSLQTETIVRMLMDASEHISMGSGSQHGHGHMCLEDAHTLVRVLCQKKDREASKFLKKQYDLPMSSEYDDTPSSDSSFGSPFISDFLKRSASLHWTKNSQSSFKSIRKKLQATTFDIRDVAR